MTTSTNEFEWLCTTRPRSRQAVKTKGLALESALWDTGQDLSIGFLQGSKKLQDRVFETAMRWRSQGKANLIFTRASKPEDADIRISFDEGGGSWSMIGTEARGVSKGDSTMNLGWVAEGTPEKDFASVVLHEFGHALGLLHEHNHPDLVLNWNKDVVYSDLMGPPNNWTRDEVDFNVFEQYPPGRVRLSDKPDLVSIMIYTIPARWLRGQKAITPSDSLSEEDKAFIRSIYP